MINDWYRLNMEIVLTANKFHGLETGSFHDELARQFERNAKSFKESRVKLVYQNIWKLFSNKTNVPVTP